MSLVEDQKLIVKAINEIRKEHGLPRITKLKRGVPEHDRACPIAMSLAETSFTSMSAFYGWAYAQKRQDLICAIDAVVFAVDTGKLPELEIPLSQIKMKKPGERKQAVIYDPQAEKEARGNTSS